jgi:chemotaxis protein CheX
MSAEVTAPKIVSMQELETGLERAIKEISTTMLNCESEIIPVSLVEAHPPGLSAVVGFGGKISGFVAVHLSPHSACNLASSLIGMEFLEMDDMVADAMGEIVNMLAGGLKKSVSKDEDLFKISVPSIVYGDEYSTHTPKSAEQVCLGIQAGGCSFSVQLVYASR